MSDDAAHVGSIGEIAAAVLPALDAFLRFDGPDPIGERPRWKARLEVPLPERGLGAAAVVDLLANVVIPDGLRIGAPGFCGWVTTMPNPVPATASFVASLAAAQKWWPSPGNFLEAQALRWLAALVGLPPEAAGVFVSGGAVANLVGLTAARQHAGERLGVDVAAAGIAALREPRIYSVAPVHHVIARAAAVLGLGRRSITAIAPRRRGVVDLDGLRDAVAADLEAGRSPIAIVATAGDVDTGAIDPIAELAVIAREFGVWLHVDGAYGGLGVLDPRVRDRYGDLGEVDSFTVDPHKWLGVPIGCGAVYVREPEVLERSLAFERASYARLRRDPSAPPASTFELYGDGEPEHSIEHSAPARGVAVWAALAEIGAAGIGARVARHLDCARRVAERVGASDRLELLAEPVLSICCFRVRPPEIRDQGTLERLNRAVVARVLARGRVVPSTTRVDNKLAIRPCFLGARTGLADADAVVDEVLAALAEIA